MPRSHVESVQIVKPFQPIADYFSVAKYFKATVSFTSGGIGRQYRLVPVMWDHTSLEVEVFGDSLVNAEYNLQMCIHCP